MLLLHFIIGDTSIAQREVDIYGFSFSIQLSKSVHAISAQVDINAKTVFVLARTWVFECISRIHIVKERIAVIWY